jgi:hypothetical protein
VVGPPMKYSTCTFGFGERDRALTGFVATL